MSGPELGRLRGRIAAAPISWGVCEVPGWGALLPTARVLAGMRACGVTATELGPPGWLPTEPAALRRELDGLRLTAGFLAVPLHRPDAMAAATPTVRALSGVGATHLVLAAATGVDGYEARPPLDRAGWAALVAGADHVAALAADHGLHAVLHPHVGTYVETPAEIEAFLADSALGLCLDTGHVLVGGGDPVALAAAHPDRVHYVHLKDADATLAASVRDGARGYADAVAAGLYRPLGHGDVDVSAFVTGLERAGYTGWYVLEQDTALPTADEPAAAAADRATLTSLHHLAAIAAALDSRAAPVAAPLVDGAALHRADGAPEPGTGPDVAFDDGAEEDFDGGGRPKRPTQTTETPDTRYQDARHGLLRCPTRTTGTPDTPDREPRSQR